MPEAPRPGALILIAALVVASTGGAFAAGLLVNGASITGTKLEPRTLSGLQTNVARLGTVPLPANLPHRGSLSGICAVDGTGPATNRRCRS